MLLEDLSDCDMNHFHDVQTQDARSGRNSQRFPQNPAHRNPPGPLWPNSGPVTTKSGNRLENCRKRNQETNHH